MVKRDLKEFVATKKAPVRKAPWVNEVRERARASKARIIESHPKK